MGDMADMINVECEDDDYTGPPLLVACKYCNKGSLMWQPRWPDGKGPWRLYEPNRMLHICKEYKKEE